MPPYMVTVGDQSAQGEIDFYYFGHHTPLLRRWAIANSDARAGSRGGSARLSRTVLDLGGG